MCIANLWCSLWRACRPQVALAVARRTGALLRAVAHREAETPRGPPGYASAHTHAQYSTTMTITLQLSSTPYAAGGRPFISLCSTLIVRPLSASGSHTALSPRRAASPPRTAPALPCPAVALVLVIIRILLVRIRHTDSHLSGAQIKL